MPRGTRMGTEWATTPKATKVPTLMDLAWAAGFIEGEGCYGRSGGTHNSQTERIQVAQKDPECLLRLQAMFGGRIGRQKSCYKNLIVKPDDPPDAISYWIATGPRARGVMLTMYPFMSQRRRAGIRKAMEKRV